MENKKRSITIQVMSDLHLEQMFDHQIGNFINQLDPTGVDVLVLAGDIVTLGNSNRNLEGFLSELVARYPCTVMVPGNHEYYYSGSLDESDFLIMEFAASQPNFHILRMNESLKPVTVNGFTFYGDTFWFPYSDDEWAKHGIMDFRLIGDIEDPKHGAYKRNENFINHYKSLKLGPTDIIVTHHTPSDKSCLPRWRGSMLNQFFHNPEMEQHVLENQPALWIHGHTHDSLDYNIGSTRVVCNPRGYGNENAKNFNPNLKIILEA